MPLTLKQQRFIDAYLGPANGNATRAARLAGYTGNDVTLQSVGKENLSKPLIQAAIAETTAAVAAASKGKVPTAEQTLLKLAALVDGDISDVLDDDGVPSYEKAVKNGKTALIHKLKETRNGTEIEIYDAIQVLDRLGKFHGLWSDETSVTIHAGAIANDLVATFLSVLDEKVTDAYLLTDIKTTLLDRMASSTP